VPDGEAYKVLKAKYIKVKIDIKRSNPVSYNTDSFPLMINLFLGTELFKHNMQMSSIWIPFAYPAILNFKIDLHVLT
jgi:hypothetical protein